MTNGPTVHPTAVLGGDVDLADDVVIGPGCVLTGPITLGAGCRIIGNAYLNGPITMGANNTVYPFACLGFAPQHRRYDSHQPGHGIAIGDENVFREHVTIHRAFTEDGPTRIGDRNYFMATSHAGHDCQIGSDNTFANATLLAGHVHVADHVTTGGNATIHQFCRAGRYAMLSGLRGASLDIPPFFTLTANNVCASVNIIGLRRAGFSREAIDNVRWMHRILYRQGFTVQTALNMLKERGDEPIVREMIDFIESSDRGICTMRGKESRGTT